MTNPLRQRQRTHTCGELRHEDVGADVLLMGWVDAIRDVGGCRFVNVRDRFGVTQLTFDKAVDAALFEESVPLRNEWVIAATGEVIARTDKNINAEMPTGEIEVRAAQLEVLNTAEVPRFPIRDEIDAHEELRLEYRFLDLRRRPLQSKIVLRAQVTHAVREVLADEGFLDLETPILTRSTPEGARDYLVPSRVHPGYFYALPQSPQIFKQIYMIAGFDRYYQIVRCFRDEDLRADRQPEFTQIDIEMSFATIDSVIGVCERMVHSLWSQFLGVELPEKFDRLTYDEAIRRFGVDAPDMRFGLELSDVSDLVASSNFGIFARAVAGGGVVRGLCVPDGADALSRKQIDAFGEFVGIYGAKGLAWAKVSDDGWSGPISRFFDEDERAAIATRMEASPGDLLLFVADSSDIAATSLGRLRVRIAKDLDLIPSDEFRFAWITDFPLLEWDADEQRWFSMHHPFTAPRDEDLDRLDADPASLRAQAYDLVLNGHEIGGGSIRIHRPELQSRIFGLLGIDDEEAEQKFGFLLRALRHGAPPHGGIAFGLDRLIMLMSGTDNIRDVIAYPKTTRAACLLSDAPSPVDDTQLTELGIALTDTAKRAQDNAEPDSPRN